MSSQKERLTLSSMNSMWKSNPHLIREVFMKYAIFMLVLIALIPADDANAFQSPTSCSPPLGACKQPVKWLADKGKCSCYACEYGTKAQHTGCTEDDKQKAVLMKLQMEEDTFQW